MSAHDRIADVLASIENYEDVRILYACESGSRGWGYPSKDSDYDVRFVYAKPLDWYLAVELDRQSDVIERGVTGDLDVSGWDLKKTLFLLAKSNPPLLEWLSSPIVYHDRDAFGARLLELASQTFSAKASAYHYGRMAKQNHDRLRRDPNCSAKLLLYILRPLFALRWLAERRAIVPMSFDTMVESCSDDESVKTAIRDLVDRKRSGDEGDRARDHTRILEFIDQEIERVDEAITSHDGQPAGFEAVNRFFRSELQRVWA